MPTFKYKTNKKIIVDDKSITTLDNRHKEMQLHFSNVKKIIIPNLLKEKRELTNVLNNMSSNNSNNMSSNNSNSNNTGGENDEKIPIEKQLEIKDRISDIKNTLKTHKNNIKQYYLSN